MDHHEFKIKEHDKKFLDLESAVAELKSRPSMTRSLPGGKDSDTSTRASGSAVWVEQHMGFRVCDYEERKHGDAATRNRGLQECARGQGGSFLPTTHLRTNCAGKGKLQVHHTGDAQHGEGAQKCEYVHD